MAIKTTPKPPGKQSRYWNYMFQIKVHTVLFVHISQIMENKKRKTYVVRLGLKKHEAVHSSTYRYVNKSSHLYSSHIYSLLICQLKVELSKTWGPAEVDTAQKTPIVRLNGVSLCCTTFGILALETVLLPARIVGDSVGHGV